MTRFSCPVVFLAINLLAMEAHAQVVRTYAGGGEGDHGLATHAAIQYPQHAVVDGSGNVYILDEGYGNVRKVDTSGVITTVAGPTVATRGYSGDGGPATSAQFSLPVGVALDAARNIYISDTYNQRIRKVDASAGIITTIAGNGTFGSSGDGGPATSATLNYPQGIASDAAGNIYICDGSASIRRVDAITGIITTFAGNGSAGYSGDGGAATNAQLYEPYAVAVDSAGNVFFSDAGTTDTIFPSPDYLIRKVDTNGIITTVAGSATNGTEGKFSGDGGPATSAGFNAISDFAVDSAGNLYIGDAGNFRIRKVVKATGIVSTVAGNGTFGYSGDGGPAISAQIGAFFNAQAAMPLGVAVDGSGNMFITDWGNSVVRKVTAATGVITTWAGDHTSKYAGDGGLATNASIGIESAQGYGFPALAFDGANNLFIADPGNYRVRRVDATTGVISTIAGNGYGTDNLCGCTPTYSGEGGLATQAELEAPLGVAADSSGNNIYIAGAAPSRLLKVATQTGIIMTVAGNGTAGFSGDGGAATAAELNGATGVAIDVSGNFYIIDGPRIRKVTKATGIINTVAGNGTYGYSGDGGPALNANIGAVAIALDKWNNIYLSTSFRIRKVTAATGIITTVAGTGAIGVPGTGDGGPATSATFDTVNHLATDQLGNFYLSDEGNGVVRKVDISTGTITTINASGLSGDLCSTAVPNGGFFSTEGVAVDSRGNLHVAAFYSSVYALVCEVLPDDIFKNGFE